MPYPCTGCGCCCKRIDVAVANASDIGLDAFPYKWDETGKCEMLSDDNKCNVYDNRPLICSIDKFIEHFELDKNATYKANVEYCNAMMNEDGITEDLRIV